MVPLCILFENGIRSNFWKVLEEAKYEHYQLKTEYTDQHWEDEDR